MKNLFAIAAIAAMFVACAGKATTESANADSTAVCCEKAAACCDSTVADSAAVADSTVADSTVVAE